MDLVLMLRIFHTWGPETHFGKCLELQIFTTPFPSPLLPTYTHTLDPAAELHVARKKIEDLEHLNRHIQTEVCVNIHHKILLIRGVLLT